MACVSRCSASKLRSKAIERVLDKGIVIDSSRPVCLVGLKIMIFQSRVVITSFDTYIEYAGAIGETMLSSAPDVDLV